MRGTVLKQSAVPTAVMPSCATMTDPSLARRPLGRFHSYWVRDLLKRSGDSLPSSEERRRLSPFQVAPQLAASAFQVCAPERFASPSHDRVSWNFRGRVASATKARTLRKLRRWSIRFLVK